MTVGVATGAVVFLHLAYLVYAAVGGFLALRNLKWLWPHLISTTWSVLVTLTALNCPLTALEKWLIAVTGRTPYEGSFTEHYLRDVLYPVEYEISIWLGMIGLACLSYVIVLTSRRTELRAAVLWHR